MKEKRDPVTSRVRSLLIIQGPIVSEGRTGESINNPNGGLGKDRIVRFNCTSTVNWYISQFSREFDLVIVSTWDSEDTDGIKLQGNVEILKNTDLLAKTTPFISQTGYAGNNTFRQMFTIQQALKEGLKKQCEIAVKVRTDTQVNAAILLESVKTDTSKLWFPKTATQLNYLEDFFIGGSVGNMKLLCDSVLEKRTFYKSPHNELFYQYVKAKESPHRVKVFDLFPKQHSWTLAQAELVRRGAQNYFDFFPIDSWNDLIWRGSGINRENWVSASDIEKVNKSIRIVPLASWIHFDLDLWIYYLLGDSLGSLYKRLKERTVLRFRSSVALGNRLLRRGR